MNASADIKTRRHDNVLSVPITAVNARVKGSDKNLAEKKKEESKMKEDMTTMIRMTMPLLLMMNWKK